MKQSNPALSRGAATARGGIDKMQRQLKALVTVPVGLMRQVEALDLLALDALADALLDFTAVSDLTDWLKKNQR